MKPVKVALLQFAGLLLVSVASASGGLSCEADDDKLTLTIESGLTRGLGSPVFNFKADAAIKATDVAADLRNTVFEQRHLPQYWLGDGDMRMVLYREREGGKPHGHVEITVRTTGDEEGYSGTYALSVIDVPSSGDQKEYAAEGKLTCFVE